MSLNEKISTYNLYNEKKGKTQIQQGTIIEYNYYI